MHAVAIRMAAKELWERAIVPSLLSGAGTWIGSTKKMKEMCEKIQEMFWQMTSEAHSLKMKH